MKIKNMLYTSILLVSTHSVLADTASSQTNVSSDRASFEMATNKLHIPFVETNARNVEMDLFLQPGNDSEGRFVFTLDTKKDLHLIHDPHFSYEGDTGPERWANLTTDNISCGIGKNQSPIDIVDDEKSSHQSVATDLTDISFNYLSSALNIKNNGHTIQVDYDEGSFINVNGKTFDLLQFHFHTPSEHTLNGQNVPMEMHMVHKSEDGALAVVGVLILAGEENAVFDDIINNIPLKESEVETIENSFVDANDLLPEQRLEYRYSGSLTTPPCSEGVKWLVLQAPIEMSQAQIEAFSSVMGESNRPVQDLNAREVLSNSASDTK